MQLNVLRELRQRIGSVTSVDIDEPAARAGDLELTDVRGTLTMLRTDRGLLVTLDAACTVPESCVRCLAEIRCPVTLRMQEEYVPVVDAETGAPVRDAEVDEGFRIGPDFNLDVREGLRQYVLMSEPVKPLCRPDCAGLCPTCGVDLNQGACGCAGQPDETWRALAALKISE
jgi:uncharacterized protein